MPSSQAGVGRARAASAFSEVSLASLSSMLTAGSLALRTLPPSRKTTMTALMQPEESATQNRRSVFFNLSSMLIGAGLLEMGYVFRLGGLVLSAVAVVVLSAVCCWTMILFQKCVERAKEVIAREDREGELVDWPIVAQAAFGRPGRLVMTAVFLVDLLLTAVMFQVLGASCLELLFPGVSAAFLLRCSGVATALMMTIPAKYWGCVSIVGILAVLLFTVSVTVESATLGVHGDSANDTLAQFANLQMVVGIVGTGMMAHTEFATIYDPMKEKEAFPKVAVASFSFAAVMYIAVGAVGCVAFGEGVHQNLIDDLRCAWLRTLAGALFAAKVLFVQPFLVSPIAATLEGAVLSLVRSRSSSGGEGRAGERAEEASARATASPRASEARTAPAASRSGGDASRLGVGVGALATTAAAAAAAVPEAQQEADDPEASPASPCAAPAPSADKPEDKEPETSPACVSLLRMLSRCLVIALVVTLTQALDENLAAVTALLGSSTSLGFSLSFPTLLYVRLFWAELPVRRRAVLITLVASGVMVQINGTRVAIASL